MLKFDPLSPGWRCFRLLINVDSTASCGGLGGGQEIQQSRIKAEVYGCKFIMAPQLVIFNIKPLKSEHLVSDESLQPHGISAKVG